MFIWYELEQFFYGNEPQCNADVRLPQEEKKAELERREVPGIEGGVAMVAGKK